MRDEIRKHLLKLRRCDIVAFRREVARDHSFSAVTNQIARGFVRHRRKAVACENRVEGVDEIGRGVDQSSVEVENDGWG